MSFIRVRMSRFSFSSMSVKRAAILGFISPLASCSAVAFIVAWFSLSCACMLRTGSEISELKLRVTLRIWSLMSRMRCRVFSVVLL